MTIPESAAAPAIFCSFDSASKSCAETSPDAKSALLRRATMGRKESESERVWEVVSRRTFNERAQQRAASLCASMRRTSLLAHLWETPLDPSRGPSLEHSLGAQCRSCTDRCRSRSLSCSRTSSRSRQHPCRSTFLALRRMSHARGPSSQTQTWALKWARKWERQTEVKWACCSVRCLERLWASSVQVTGMLAQWLVPRCIRCTPWWCSRTQSCTRSGQWARHRHCQQSRCLALRRKSRSEHRCIGC